MSSSGSAGGNDLIFDRAWGAGYSTVLTMRRDTGNVGIGTTSPSAKLEIIGD